MEESPYEKLQKQRIESENEHFRQNVEMLREEERRKREIGEELDTIISQNRPKSDEKWYKKPVGIIVIAIIGGLLLAAIKFVIGF